MIHMMLDIDSLSFDYQDKPLLSQINLSLALGQLLHLKGSNGVGKTTLLKLIAGLLSPRDGEIRYANQPINHNLPAYQQNLCYVGHKTGLSPLLTVRENCFFDLHWRSQTRPDDELLQQFGLQELRDVYCYQLSVGQQKRVSLLRLAMTEAPLWLLDEPLVALDQKTIIAFMTCLKNHLDEGGQVILTSHQLLPLGYFDYQEYML